MPYDDLKKKLAGFLDSTIGDQKAEGDEITPTSSPIDYLAGGIGSKLGQSLAAEAGPIVGNEIGAIGSDINMGYLKPTVPKAGYLQQKVIDAQNVVNGASNMTDLQNAMNQAGVAERAAERAAKYAALKKQLR